MNADAVNAAGAVLIASGVVAIIFSIAMIVSANVWPVVASMPLAEGQWVAFDAPGVYNLYRDSGGMLTLAYLGLSYSLQSADGKEVPAWIPLTHGGPNGTALRCFNVPAAGSYYLRVWRLGDRDVTALRLNFKHALPFKGWGYLGGIAIGVLAVVGGLLMLAR